MISKKFRDKPSMPFRLEEFSNTKSVRNFLCDWLYDDSLVVSYAPSSEFAANAMWRFFFGGWVVEFDPEISSYCQRKPLYKVNFRIIKELYRCGFLVARPDLKVPNERFIMFSWSKKAIENRRDILRTHILDNKSMVTNRVLDALAAQYGLKIIFSSSSATYQIAKADGTNIPKGTAPRTWVLSNSLGEPVGRLNDMPLLEWEQVLYSAAKRGSTLGKPSELPEGTPTHISALRKG